MAERKTTTKAAAAKPAAKPKPKPKPRAKAAAAKPAAARKATAKKPAAAKPAPKPRVTTKPAQRESKRTSAARTRDEAARDVALFDSLGALRDALAEHLVLTAERVQDALDDAVRRGRMVPSDATDITQRVSQAGRRQLDELLAELDRRFGRGR